MLSDDLSNLRDWIDRRVDQDGILTLPADLTGVVRFMLRDMTRTARALPTRHPRAASSRAEQDRPRRRW